MQNRNLEVLAQTPVSSNSPAESLKKSFATANKYERRNKMKFIHQTTLRKLAFRALLIAVLQAAAFFATGCSDKSNPAGTGSGVNESVYGKGDAGSVNDSTKIKLGLSVSYKSESFSDSKLMESNNGQNFNHIETVNLELKPQQEIDLQDIQQAGIFALYLNSNGNFSLRNRDGLQMKAKTVLLDKCEFIDLTLRNEDAKTITVKGFVAGE